MNCSDRAPMTFSMEVEPLVETLPDRSAGLLSVLSSAAALEAGVLAGALLLSPVLVLLLPPQEASAKAMVRASSREMIFFMFLVTSLFVVLDDVSRVRLY